MDISDYYLIGDLHTAALVADGNIDWLCLPAFDSPSVFAALLDEDGGAFRVKGSPQSTQYKKDTAIVESVFDHFRLFDYMSPRPTTSCDTHVLYRKIKAEESVTVTFEFEPRPDYARGDVSLMVENGDVRVNESFRLHLPSTASVDMNGDTALIHVHVEAGEEQLLCFEYHERSSCKVRDEEAEVRAFWQDWVEKGEFMDFCRDELVRSAITLKLMQYYPTGALIAAPTTSLPEELGGVRNWDYRYVWIRDATFTLYSFYVLGYTDEAAAFFSFIEDIMQRCDRCGDIELMYTIRGEPVPSEQELDMEGFAHSQPVRIGNGAKDQFQLDVYGALIDAYYFMHDRGLTLDDSAEGLIRRLADTIVDRWREPDRGIWEVRSGDEQFTYSKVMAWVGLDRAVTLFEGMEGCDGVDVWKRTAGEIEEWVWEHCYEEGKLKQHPDTERQDATTFLFVLLKFLDKYEERTHDIVERARSSLVEDDVFVYRYRGDDGLEGDEGSFVLCTFWLISALAILEEVDEARRLFAQIEQYIADNGLMSEELDDDGLYLGNYPQAFSHMGYIMAAHYLQKYQERDT